MLFSHGTICYFVNIAEFRCLFTCFSRLYGDTMRMWRQLNHFDWFHLTQQFKLSRHCSSISKKLDGVETPTSSSVKQILQNGSPGDTVKVQGWVRAVRKQKTNVFLDIGDGLTPKRLQVTVPASQLPKELSIHSSIEATGVLVPLPHKPDVLELQPDGEITVVGPCNQNEYPFQGKVRYELEYIRQFIHLRPKTNTFSSLFRLRSHVTRSISNYFHSNDFIQVQTPILTSNDCEGAGEVFLVKPAKAHTDHVASTDSTSTVISTSHSQPSDVKLEKPLDPDQAFFSRRVYLTVSGQLHLEAMASGIERVWTMSPVFRAENCRSTRHLSEFYMVEAELAFAYDIHQILEIQENLVKTVVNDVLNSHGEEREICTSGLDKSAVKSSAELLQGIATKPFTVMTFQEASEILQSKLKSTVNPSQGLSREQELMLVEKLNDNIPVFVIDWPSDIKPFYVRHTPSGLASAVDLLVPGVGELCGGSLREDSHDNLVQRLKSIDPSHTTLESLQWYLDLRKFGGVPTGGFGLGFDRLMLLLTGGHNIKDMTPFPRWTHNCPL